MGSTGRPRHHPLSKGAKNSRAIVMMKTRQWMVLFLVAAFCGCCCTIPKAVAFNNSNKPSNNNKNSENKIIQPQLGNMKLSSLLSSEEVRSRLVKELQRLREKDRKSKTLSAKVRNVDFFQLVVVFVCNFCTPSCFTFRSSTFFLALK